MPTLRLPYSSRPGPQQLSYSLTQNQGQSHGSLYTPPSSTGDRGTTPPGTVRGPDGSLHPNINQHQLSPDGVSPLNLPFSSRHDHSSLSSAHTQSLHRTPSQNAGVKPPAPPSAFPPSPPLTRVGTNDSVKSTPAADTEETRASGDVTHYAEEKQKDDDVGGDTTVIEAKRSAEDPLSVGHDTTLAEDGDETDMSEATHMHLKANPATPSWTDDDPLRKPSSSLSPLSQTPLQQAQQPEHHNPLEEISAQPKDVVDEPVNSTIDHGAASTAVSQDALKRARKVSTVRPKIPHSSYYFGPPPADAAYGTPPCGHFGLHHPREIIRVERDYSGGELVQFSPSYPLELEGRITPTQFLETINAINELLISAHSLTWSFVDNTTAILSLYLTRLLFKSHYDKEMLKLKQLLDRLNAELYHPRGLHILWPRNVAFLFLEIEYY